MNVGSVGNLYTYAPGTSNSPIRPEADLSFEESNDAVDKTIDRVDDARETQDAKQDLTRQAAVSLVDAKFQQDNIERYVEASTGTETSNNGALNLNNTVDALKANQLANKVDDITPIRDTESLQSQLQERIDNIVNDNETGSTLSYIA